MKDEILVGYNQFSAWPVCLGSTGIWVWMDMEDVFYIFIYVTCSTSTLRTTLRCMHTSSNQQSTLLVGFVVESCAEFLLGI